MRGGGPYTSGTGSATRFRGAGTRRNGTVNSILIAGLTSPELQGDGSSRSVITNLLHQGAYQPKGPFFEVLPILFRNIEPFPRFHCAHGRSKPVDDGIFDHARRH